MSDRLLGWPVTLPQLDSWSESTSGGAALAVAGRIGAGWALSLSGVQAGIGGAAKGLHIFFIMSK